MRETPAGMQHPTRWVAGVDGCRGGWAYVAIDDDGRYDFGIEESFAGAIESLTGAQLILVDIPIGLPTPNLPKRLCDTAARRAIAPRGSSVFPVPARSALGCRSYEQACEENFRILGRRLSRQTWAIAPKIREVDDFMRLARPGPKIREMHPEVAFWALNGGRSLIHAKKRAAGQEERLEILSRRYAGAQECYEACCARFRRAEVARDDILDAIAGAVAAHYSPALGTLPEHPPRDEEGLPMEIVYPVTS